MASDDLPEWLKGNYRQMVDSGVPAEQIAARIEQQDGAGCQLAAYVRSLTVADKRSAPRGRRAPSKSRGG